MGKPNKKASNKLTADHHRVRKKSKTDDKWKSFFANTKPACDVETDLYLAAARVISEVMSNHATVRSSIYASNYIQKKPLMAVVTKCLSKTDILAEVLHACEQNASDDDDMSRLTVMPVELQWIILYDVCFGQPSRMNQYYRQVKPLESFLKMTCADVLERQQQNQQISSQSASLVSVPRYVRINQLVEKRRSRVIEELTKDSLFTLVETPSTTTWSEFSDAVKNLQPQQFLRDFHLNRSLLVFHPSAEFYQHPLYLSGALILQDKASCLAAHLLRPERNSIVIDACAAPGMKTSMLSAIMHNTGQIYAIDMDAARCTIMQTMLQTNNATNVHLLCQDFLKINPNSKPYCDAEFILVDPSCSGSGIVSRNNNPIMSNQANQYDKSRLHKLQVFQVLMLKHALSFPRVKRIVYSTCSIFAEENEHVVARALAERDEKDFVVQDLSKFWSSNDESSADADDEISSKTLRLTPEQHLTNGFFIAVLERRQKE